MLELEPSLISFAGSVPLNREVGGGGDKRKRRRQEVCGGIILDSSVKGGRGDYSRKVIT